MCKAFWWFIDKILWKNPMGWGVNGFYAVLIAETGVFGGFCLYLGHFDAMASVTMIVQVSHQGTFGRGGDVLA